MKLNLPENVSSVSVDGRHFVGAKGIVDVGNLDGASIDKLILHAGCTLAGADDEVNAEAREAERLERDAVVARLKELGIKADGRMKLPALQDILFNAEATEAYRKKNATDPGKALSTSPIDQA